MHGRFYAPAASVGGTTVRLPQEEATHLTRVLRLNTGARVRVFDGHGKEFEAVVTAAEKDHVEVALGSPARAAQEASVSVTLVQAVLKQDKMDGVVRDAVMIGVTAIQPLMTNRTETTAATLERSRRRERWHRIAVASAKQCGRAVVPPVLEILEAGDLRRRLEERALPSPAFMLVEPGASADTVSPRDLAAAPPERAALIVGPEGGWTAEELHSMSGVCQFLSLGSRTLRAETAALVAMAALYVRWEEY